MRRRALLRDSFRAVTLLGLWAGVLSAPAAADDSNQFLEAVERLNQMSVAMSQMTYQGTFVYVQGALVETMRVTHVVDENGVKERLVAETGQQRELWRDSNGVQWISKNNRAVLHDPSLSRSYFPEVNAGAIEKAGDYYELELGGLEPIAGRLGRRLDIRPQDQYRYGYSLWLEESSSLLLRWEIYQTPSRPLARLMFTDIRIGQEVDHGELDASNAMQDYRTESSRLPEKQFVTRAEPQWAPSRLPPGFTLTTHRRQGKQSEDMFLHLVYSDGIATVSVYVEPADNGQPQTEGTSQLGTTHAFSRRVNGIQITVVGDVPAETVQEIGTSVNRKTP